MDSHTSGSTTGGDFLSMSTAEARSVDDGAAAATAATAATTKKGAAGGSDDGAVDDTQQALVANPGHPKLMDTTMMRAVGNCVLLALTGVILGETLTSVSEYTRRKRLGGVETRMISNGIMASSVTFWPVLWDMTVGWEQLVDRPKMAFGFYWPLVISTMDMIYIMDERKNSHGDMNKLERTLGADAQSLISAAFAVGALMSTLRSVQSVHLILYALIACLALVIPQVSVPNNSTDRNIIVSAQKAALNYAIGYIVAGIGADFLQGGAKNKVYRRM